MQKRFFSHFLVFALGCLMAAAPARAVVTDGANAENILGQYDPIATTTPIYTKQAAHNAPHDYGFDYPYDVAIDTTNHRLFVSDYNNNRVLVFNLAADNTLTDYGADYVLGQTTFSTGSGVTTDYGLRNPAGLAYDSAGNRLFVADLTNNRVLVYDVATITNGESAVNVLGQADFVSSGAAATQAGMSAPKGLAYDAANTRLFVANGSNNRVTVYDVASITDGENATKVLGQSNFTNSGTATTQAGMNSPQGLAYDAANTRLFVADNGNNRVVVYDVASITDGENATKVLGQSNFTSSGGVQSQSGMSGPFGLAYDSANSRLFVSESTNNRVTAFDVTSITDGENAASLLGQTDFAFASAATSQDGMTSPQGIAYDATNSRLFVAQSTNRRITVYDVASITDGENAIDVIGQYSTFLPVTVNYEKSAVNNTPHPYGFNSPTTVAVDSVNHRLFVADNSNNRVLVFNLSTDNTLSDRTPDNVLGQPDFVSSASATTQDGMCGPQGVLHDSANNRLFVAQLGCHRVTVYDVASITDGENAIHVLGQADFTSTGGANTQAGMSGPRGMAYDYARNYLFVAQGSNHRVTVYDVASITDGENAIKVLGQTNFTNSANANTQTGMNTPRALAYDAAGKRLFVVQSGNHRVTVYDMTAITDGEAAINVLGQTNFTNSSSANTQTGMNAPQGAAYDPVNNRLFVAQSLSNRVTVYDVASITNGEAAINILGQSSYTVATAATTQAGMRTPQGVAYDPTTGKVYVPQSGAHRITVYDGSYLGNGFMSFGE